MCTCATSAINFISKNFLFQLSVNLKEIFNKHEQSAKMAEKGDTSDSVAEPTADQAADMEQAPSGVPEPASTDQPADMEQASDQTDPPPSEEEPKAKPKPKPKSTGLPSLEYVR